MTAVSDRLDAIQAQLDAAEPGPWFLDGDGVSIYYVFHNGETPDRDRVAESSGADAVFIAAAPENTRYLLDLARKQQAQLEAVRALAEQWQEDFPHKANRIREALDGAA
ncbi:hypothetical protein SEA_MIDNIGHTRAIN_50 [Arthrobacter phage MidnightRain]|nr:hypothetical protein SEA_MIDNIGHTRAIN_50 [Arthrobacter phage MidnightRain]